MRQIVLDKYSNSIKSTCIELTFKEYYKKLKAHFESNKQYSNFHKLSKNNETKTIAVASGGIYVTDKHAIEYKTLKAKIHFYIQFEEKDNKLYPIKYGFTFYRDEHNQFRFDKEETLNDFVHPNCHLTVGKARQPRYPTPCLDIFYILFFIEGLKLS